MNKNGLLILFLFVLFGNGSYAQDAHFSQWQSAPLTLNPAMTGLFNGTFRFSNDYRSQWSGITKAYTDIHVSLDLPVAKEILKNGQFFGVGLLLMQNRAGNDAFRQTVVQTSLSFTTPMDDGDNFISVGFQGGLNQNSVDLSKATWGSQWNGDNFDPTAGNTVELQLSQFSFVDLSAGVFWHYVPDQYNNLHIGAALQHIGGENTSFYKDVVNPINRRITAHIGSEISLTDEHQSWFMPRALFMMQGQQKQIAWGFNIKNKVKFKSQYTDYQKEVMYSLGLHYRFQDAFIFSLRFEYNNLLIGASYDYTASSLQKRAGAGSAFEITIGIINPIKKGQQRNNYNKMPRYF